MIRLNLSKTTQKPVKTLVCGWCRDSKKIDNGFVHSNASGKTFQVNVFNSSGIKTQNYPNREEFWCRFFENAEIKQSGFKNIHRIENSQIQLTFNLNEALEIQNINVHLKNESAFSLIEETMSWSQKILRFFHTGRIAC
ncbi:MAG: hypothetical protein QNJ31_04190 [Candidatus Caenarcaniphilales bacterium]|nr:hypothetical protein [Candidatus Caenarcaniphilales bacterium]